jgi:ketosteroid isomerase-like protein
MDESSAVAVVRRFYRAIADRDLEAAGACFADDAVWILPGRSAIAGEHRGWKAIHDDFLVKLQPLPGGTFKVELLDVALGDGQLVAVQRATAERDGTSLDITACLLIRVEGGKIAEIRGHYSDQYALDDFWS